MAFKKGTREKVSAKLRQLADESSIDEKTRILHVDEVPCNQTEDQEEEEDQEDQEDDDQEEGSLVFLCAKCNLTVGDSLSWSGSDEDGEIHLSRVTDNVVMGTENHLYEPRPGRRCLIVDLSCKGCQSALGMVYLSTPKALDYKRLAFCFQVQQLESYLLGSANQKMSAESPLEQPLTLEKRGLVEQQLVEMKTLVVSMAQRLQSIEGGLQVDLDESLPL
ncbi:hypothetical protein NHX12_010240 [Muraenolepis orangiensis]|uniref:Protein Mis18-alpha n=1 Tax=Muraenolepis orangiensis TaxID=630683 RepID=A0A9Q0DIQ6_9TELE|nr:hypothetical protein NHX12_010240 [Muraenolepis orangiensis]